MLTVQQFPIYNTSMRNSASSVEGLYAGTNWYMRLRAAGKETIRTNGEVDNGALAALAYWWPVISLPMVMFIIAVVYGLIYG